jgi:phosphate uptake regulator
MKRRIIKQGHNAFTITLPTNWVKNLNLKPKEEIDVVENGNQLIINAKKNSNKNSISFDLSGLPIPILWKYISTIYREGYDEIIINFKDPYKKYENAYSYSTAYSEDVKIPREEKNVFSTIMDIANRFIGIEIIDFKKDHCVIRQMEEPSDKQFDNAVKRIYFIIDQFFQDLIIAIEKDDLRVLEETHITDTNLDRFHDFCCRVLNKTGSRSPHKSQLTFTTLYILEMLADEFKNISNYLLGKGKITDKKAMLKFCKIIYKQYELYKSLVDKFDADLIKEIYNTSFNLFQDSPDIYSKKRNGDLEVFYHLRKISEYIYSLTELRLEEEFHDNSLKSSPE